MEYLSCYNDNAPSSSFENALIAGKVLYFESIKDIKTCFEEKKQYFLHDMYCWERVRVKRFQFQLSLFGQQGGGCGSIERESGVQTKDNEEEEKEDRRWF